MNKFYIQIVLFLLSISIYVNNKTLATEPDPGENTKPEPEYCCVTPEEIYEQNKHLLCTNPEETINAEKLMNEAVTHLENHINDKDSYEICKWKARKDTTCRKKRLEGNTIVQRVNFQYFHSNKVSINEQYNYNEIINMLWDPDLANNFNNGSVKRKIERVYNPNLIMIQQRYKSWFGGREKYFYALAAKFDISKDKAIIVMTSANIIDHHPSKKEYKNKIIENANLFTTEIDSEEDIRKGKLEKIFVNIAGYLIEKKGLCVNITHLESIDGHISKGQELIIEKSLNKFFHYKNI
ncbi:fam-a protein [Plasmodium chabaudi chabaudi]|uniref:Fam-a protein n=1 Tax=Plasmodium chabaudi chabaudi TaxID=31271 RepID=A0A077TGP7_PLACU|nr:fam-a protein [Plasmodium chabaudi chabaudi]SCL88860.1 fam-a protein [Plasmodium chabaudi chabaudi]VTZ66916.1 fam-a protein [Plasmodium chabaudi chabaudi]|eukprot:XP_016653126.1 fam-a protein [Plasmodium chabaudi chabaudi]